MFILLFTSIFLLQINSIILATSTSTTVWTCSRYKKSILWFFCIFLIIFVYKFLARSIHFFPMMLQHDTIFLFVCSFEKFTEKTALQVVCISEGTV